jgi:hypothetical protein
MYVGSRYRGFGTWLRRFYAVFTSGLSRFGGANVNEKIMEFRTLASEMVAMMRTRKTMWLAPVIFVLLLMGVLIVALEGSALAPLIYTIF